MKNFVLNKPLAGFAALAACSLLLAACGSSSSSDKGPSSQIKEVQGIAADGYLRGARACLDINENKRCDADEPQAETIAGGRFELEAATSDIEKYAIVIEVIPSTIDEDTGEAVEKPYVLSAPPGKPGFVSPLTTAVHGILQTNPALGADEAAAALRAQIGAGLDISLFEDYVAQEESDPSYKRLHRIAQVSAKILAENQAAIDEAVKAGGNIDPAGESAHLNAIIVEELLDQLESKVKEVDDVGENFDIARVEVKSSLDSQGLAGRLERAKERANVRPIAFKTLLEQGVHWMEDGEGAWVEYGSLRLGSSNKIDEQICTSESGSFQCDGEDGYEHDDNPPRVLLTREGWTGEKLREADLGDITFSGNSVILTLQEEGMSVGDRYKMTASEVDVSGKRIVDSLDGPWTTHAKSSVSPQNATFSSGAKAYIINYVQEMDAYELEWWDCSDAPDQNCNKAVEGDDLDDLFNSSSHWVGDELSIQLQEDKKVRVWLENKEAALQGTWRDVTVYGQTLRIVTLPDGYKNLVWEEAAQPFFAVQDGYVRQGFYYPKGSTSIDPLPWLNERAIEDFKNHYKSEQ